uniref:Ribonuclease T2-like n=1 Tax=Sinocyclocheilus anshuiensis TaxID=1608454 RepID=A0A671PF12_9TELE
MRFIAVAAILCVGYFCPTAFAHPRYVIQLHLFIHIDEPNTGMRCNTSWHFNASLIEDLIPEMEKYWPDLLAPSSPKFWQYEWIKHGTCAAKADSLNSQHKYFSKALELNLKYDLNSVLKNNKIVPSEEYYTLDQVETAITSFFGVKPKIQCVHPGKGGQVQTLGQIELCVDRDFQLIDCEKSTKEIWSNAIPEVLVGGQSDLSVCDHSVPVYYPPVPSRS